MAGRVGARFALGNAFVREGRAAAAIPPLEAARALSAEYELENWKPAVLSALGAAHVATGRIAEGRREIEEAVRYAEAARILSGHSMWLVYLGEALLRDGRPAEARAQAQRALEYARRRDERGFEAWASLQLGAAAAATGDAGAATEAYRTALGMAEELGMRPLADRCRAALTHPQGEIR